MLSPGLQHGDEFPEAGRVPWVQDLGGFHAKPELYSRKEGEVLQNPLSPELPRANALTLSSNDAGGPEGRGRRTRRRALTESGLHKRNTQWELMTSDWWLV